MNYYTSDLHLMDERILALCKRPFKTVDEMNEYIISSINDRVSKDDTLYILGDVAPYDKNVVDLLRQIKGKLVLIIGNHDRGQLKHGTFRRCFSEIHESLMLKDGEYDLFLSHFPYAEWDGFYKGRYHFYGHVHNKLDGGAALMALLPQAVNVGMDINEFMPKTAEEFIRERLANYRIPEDLEAFITSITHPMVDDRAGKKLIPSRVVKIYAGMAPEYEVIRTNAPDEDIETQMALINYMEEYGYSIDNPYDYLERKGYFVIVLGSHDDFWDKELNEDGSFDYYDVDEVTHLFAYENMYLEKLTKYMKDNNVENKEQIDRLDIAYKNGIIDNAETLIGLFVSNCCNDIFERLKILIIANNGGDENLKKLALDAKQLLISNGYGTEGGNN